MNLQHILQIFALTLELLSLDLNHPIFLIHQDSLYAVRLRCNDAQGHSTTRLANFLGLGSIEPVDHVLDIHLTEKGDLQIQLE